MPSNVLPLQLKQTFPPGIKSRLPFKKNFTLQFSLTSGPPPHELLASLQTQMDPSQSLFTDPATGLLMPPLPVAVKSNYGEMSIFDLLTNETVVKKLLSFLEQQNDENKESEENEGNNAAFLAQENQASNTIAGNEVYICLGLV